MSAAIQDKIQGLLDTLVVTGEERGVQVSVYRNGVEIVDASTGTTGGQAPLAVDRDTLFPIFSTMKGIMATAVHLLAERRQVDYDASIARYWPEFGANGKAGITVRHALAHQAAIPYLPDDVSQEQLNDWEAMCRVVEGLTPAWEPGTRQFYHAHTLSWILGELIRRVDGRAFQPFIAAEINQPLRVEFYSGLPDGLESRVAWIEPASDFTETLSPPPRTNAVCTCPAHDWINRSDARRLCHPGVNGISNARAIARHYAALLPQGVDGVEFFPPARVGTMTELQTPSDRWAEDMSARKGLGYQLGHSVPGMGNDPASFGHLGHGGSVGFASPRHRLAVGIVRNRFSPKSLGVEIWNELNAEFELA